MHLCLDNLREHFPYLVILEQNFTEKGAAGPTIRTEELIVDVHDPTFISRNRSFLWIIKTIKCKSLQISLQTDLPRHLAYCGEIVCVICG